jgi:2-hydroxy-6-oxonona-2,4-dienedioate hydrolase
MFPEQTPASLVAMLQEQADQIETPCGDGTMAWWRWGQGPALLLLHGGHGSWTHWIRNVPYLAERWSVVAPDMPGFGDSASPPDPTDPMSLANVLARGLDDVFPGNGPIIIVGFSFGSIIAGHLARLRPDRTAHLVLVGASGLGLTRPSLEPLKSWRRLETQEERYEAHRANLAILMFHDSSRIDTLALHLQAENTSRARIDSPTISRTDTLRRCLYELTVPISGIWGEADATSGKFLDERRNLIRAVDPGSNFVVIPDAGHWVQYEAPEAFNRALAEMLNISRPSS